MFLVFEVVLWSFLSPRMQHKRRMGTIHIAVICGILMKTTLLSITQANPILPKTTSSHRAMATSQWSNKWSIVSPLFLHIQHQSITIVWHFQFSMVRIFPNVAVHMKSSTLASWHRAHTPGLNVPCISFLTMPWLPILAYWFM